MTFENDGKFNLRDFYESCEDWSNVSITEWDDKNEKIMELDTKITGIPYYNTTKSKITLKKKVKTDSMFVVELTSETFDLP